MAQTAIDQAREAGISHLVIFGNPAYYPKYGFVTARQLGIYLENQDKEEVLDFVLALDLQGDGSISLENGPWLYKDPDGYQVDEATLEEFDKNFPPKQKKAARAVRVGDEMKGGDHVQKKMEEVAVYIQQYIHDGLCLEDLAR